jgi:hypothetical protein
MKIALPSEAFIRETTPNLEPVMITIKSRE